MLGRLPRPLQRKCGQRENKLMKYTEEHDWLRVEGELVVVGITKFATEQLGDVVFVELPDPGTLVSRGDEIAVIESAKTASEISAMYDGEIVAVNEALVEAPSLVNEDPTGAAWFFKIKLADMAVLDALMDEAAYKDMIA
jgi:glycine cleavage system H protein